jgi:hypothetical protein
MYVMNNFTFKMLSVFAYYISSYKHNVMVQEGNLYYGLKSAFILQEW